MKRACLVNAQSLMVLQIWLKLATDLNAYRINTVSGSSISQRYGGIKDFEAI